MGDWYQLFIYLSIFYAQRVVHRLVVLARLPLAIETMTTSICTPLSYR